MKRQDDRSRLLSLLDQAYATSEQQDDFDPLMEAANAYFLAGSRSMARDIPRHMYDDPSLQRHVERLQRILSSSDDKTGKFRKLVDASYAQLILDRSGAIIMGNRAAELLCGTQFPCALEKLRLDRASTQSLQRLLAKLNSGIDEQERIVRLVLEDTGEMQVGCCAVLDDESGKEKHLGLSLSFVDWQLKSDIFTREPFGLTRAEADIMIGLLGGQSQREIATARDRSLETIKSQSKAILRKTGFEKMSDVLQMATAMAYLTELSESQPDQSAASGVIDTVDGKLLETSDGRMVEFRIFGPDDGYPVLFVHSLLQGPFFQPAFIEGLFRHNVRLLAPSRPGFGRTSHPLPGAEFDRTVIDDSIALLDHHDVGTVHLVAHQGGVSHAYRLAGRISNRLQGMLLIGAGIPIDENAHLDGMNAMTRMAAIATRHAPVVMEMLTGIAISVYMKKGIDKFYNTFHADDPVDLAALRDPAVYDILEKGIHHLIAQGTKAFIRDGAAAMANWSADYERVSKPAKWIHAQHDPVMGHSFVRQWVSQQAAGTVEIVPDAGLCLLHTHHELLLDRLAAAVQAK